MSGIAGRVCGGNRPVPVLCGRMSTWVRRILGCRFFPRNGRLAPAILRAAGLVAHRVETLDLAGLHILSAGGVADCGACEAKADGEEKTNYRGARMAPGSVNPAGMGAFPPAGSASAPIVPCTAPVALATTGAPLCRDAYQVGETAAVRR